VIAAATGLAPLLNGDPAADDNAPVEVLPRNPNKLAPAEVLAVTYTNSEALAVPVAVLVGVAVVLEVPLELALEVALIPSTEISEP